MFHAEIASVFMIYLHFKFLIYNPADLLVTGTAEAK
jgi:hypothetical protein